MSPGSLIGELIAAGPVLTDGAWGTELQSRGLEAGEVLLTVDADTVRLPIEAIAKARLVLTDELIAAAQEASGV